ncbi:MAG: metallophosphoesterase [Promethearchaeota archaeon]
MIKIKIGVFSDSHDHMENIRKAIEIFLEQKVEKIVHCGDIVAPFMVRAMSELKGKPIEVIGIYGNNDGERLGLYKILGEIMKMKGDFYDVIWDEKKIGVYHGTDNRILESLIKSQIYDLVLCGHTHQVRVEQQGRTIILNPGETCGYLFGKATCAVVDLASEPFDTNSIKILDIPD